MANLTGTISAISAGRGSINDPYGIRWKTDWFSLKQNVSWSVRILEDGYSGAINEIDVMDREPLTIRNRGGRDVLDDLIISTEARFKFWLKDSADQTEYLDLFQADERQFKIEVFRNGFIYFIGYQDPEKMGRQFVGNQQSVDIVFTDQLKTLREYTLVDGSGAPLVTELSGLEVLKECLQYTDIHLPFRVQLNTYEENLMTSSECALDKVSHKMTRFNKSDDGRLVAEDCKTAINEILKLYNCQIRQVDGAYLITNIVEANSFVYTFDWDTLTEQSRVAYNTQVNIDPEFKDKGQLSFVAPVRNVNIKFRNRYEGDNVFSNGGFDSGTTGWSNGAIPNDFDTFNVSSETNPRLNLAASDNVAKYFESDSFGLTVQGSSDSIYVKLKAEIFSVTYTQPNPAPRAPFLYFSIIYPDTSEVFSVTQGMLEGGNYEYEASFPLDQTGNYKLRVWFEPNALGQIDNIAYRVDDIFTKALYEDGTITYDRFYSNTNTNLAKQRTKDVETVFGDANNDADVGVLKVGASRTSSWNSYGNTEQLPLMALLGKQLLELYPRYKDYIRVRLDDPHGQVKPDTVLTIDSKSYRFVNYSRESWSNEVSGELAEIPADAITHSWSSQDLATVDGESEPSGTTVSTGGGGGGAVDTVTGSNGVTASPTTGDVVVSLNVPGLPELLSGLASTDELIVNDAGVHKRMDVSVLQTYMQNNLGFVTANNYLTGLSFNTTNGVLTATINGLPDETVNLDGRYLLSGTYDNYVSWTIDDGVNSEAITSGASLIVSGGTDIDATYNPANNTLTIAYNGGAMSSWTVAADTGSESIGNGTTVTWVGGTNISTSYNATNNQLTINSTATDTNDYATGATFATGTGILTITVQNQPDVTVDLDGRYLLSGTYDNYVSWTIDDGVNSEGITSGASLIVAGGTDIDTTYNPANNTLTIDYTGTAMTSWTVAGETGSEAIGNGTTVNFVGSGVISTAYDSGSNNLTISTSFSQVQDDTSPTLGGNLDANSNNITNLNLIQGPNAAGQDQFRTGNAAGSYWDFRARDTDGAVWVTFATMTAGTTPTFDLSTAVTVGGVGPIATQTWVSANFNNYVHPTQAAISVTTTGAEVIDNIEVNTAGHTTVVTKRTMTLANLGYTGANDADKYTSWTVAGDSGSEAVTTLQTVNFAGGTGITTAYDSGTNTLTITNSSIYTSWTVAGDTGSESVVNGQTVTFVGGSNVTTTYSAVGNTLTIDASFTDTNNYVTGATFATGTGVLTLTRQGLTDVTVNLDGRYQLSGTYDNYVSWTVDDGTNSEAITSGASVIFAGGSNISTTYSAASNTMTIAYTGTVYTGWTVAGDTGSESIGNGTTVTFVGGTNINTSYNSTTNELTIDAAGTDTNDFATGATFATGTGVLTITVSNQPDVTVDLDGRYAQGTFDNYQYWTVTGDTGTESIGSTSGVTFAGGTNISTSYSTSTNTLTINYTGSAVTGSGSNGRVAYWNGTSSITSSANFTFSGTNAYISGNLGLGVTAAQKLDVNGIIQTRSRFKATNIAQTDDILTADDGTTEIFAISRESGNVIHFDSYLSSGFQFVDKVGIGTAPSTSYLLNVNGIVNGTDIRRSSDRALKKNERPAEDLFDSVLKMAKKVKRFEMKSTGESKIGWIAQDLEKIRPEIVHLDKTFGIRTIAQGSEIIAPLYQAVDKLNDRLEALEDHIRPLIN